MGVFQAKLAIQTTAIILYAWNWVCHLLDFRGLQIAKYLSSDIATNVHTPTETETAEKIERMNKKYSNKRMCKCNVALQLVLDCELQVVA